MAIESFSNPPPGAALVARSPDPAQQRGRVAAIVAERAQRAAAAEDEAAKTKPERDAEAIAEIAEEANRRLESTGASLEFSIDETTGRVVLTVVDRQTHEVIRQVPSKTALAIAATLGKLLPGAIMQEQA